MRSDSPFTRSLFCRHVSPTAVTSCVNCALGKYVAAKNGSPSGVMNTVIGQPPWPRFIAWVAAMYTASMSGRSSRSTLMATTLSLTTAAVAGSSNDSCAITWHQWQAAYPTDSSTGTSRRRASANASSVHGHQSTGLSACCSRYGLVALFSRLLMTSILIPNVSG